MTVRPLEDSDIPILREMFEASGFAYEFPDLRGPLIEAVLVLVDDDDIPVMAVAAERIVQLYLLVGKATPAAKMAGIRSFHERLSRELRKLGYDDANAFLPPQLEKQFGRRLERSFRWVKNWASWCIRF